MKILERLLNLSLATLFLIALTEADSLSEYLLATNVVAFTALLARK